MTENTIEVDPVEIIEKDADDRGRVYLGSEYSGDRVRIAIIDSIER